jgi:hypothetical protein
VRNWVGELEQLVDGRNKGGGAEPHHGRRPRRSSARGISRGRARAEENSCSQSPSARAAPRGQPASTLEEEPSLTMAAGHGGALPGDLPAAESLGGGEFLLGSRRRPEQPAKHTKISGSRRDESERG